ncbi:DoxX family protein [Candidatus Woesearchaeota archaeon]|nr:DoxX family protein [Candidatus Woesearchaeota archaeon]
MLSKYLEPYKQWGKVPLRLVLGGGFVAHGLVKFMSLAATVGFFAGMGFPAGTAQFVAAVEVLGGAMLVLGLFTRWAAAVLTVLLLVAIAKVKGAMGWMGGWELDAVYIAGLLSLLVTGGGKVWNLERHLTSNER